MVIGFTIRKKIVNVEKSRCGEVRNPKIGFMKNILNSQRIKCLFGYHKYTIPHKELPYILLCVHCKIFGYHKDSSGYEVWYEYDERRNIIHWKDSNGNEFDEKGNMIKNNKNNL